MIVQFVGLSGVGKSTLIRDVEHLLRSSSEVTVACHDARSTRLDASGKRSSQWRNLLRGAVGAPRVGLIAARTLRDGRGHALRRYLRAIGYVMPLRKSAGVHLIDEGPMKLLPTSEPFSPWWTELRASVPDADLFVHVVCGSDVRIARVRRLDRPHGRTLTDEELRTIETFSLDRLREALASREASVLTVNPTDDPTAAASVAAAIIALHRAMA